MGQEEIPASPPPYCEPHLQVKLLETWLAGLLCGAAAFLAELQQLRELYLARRARSTWQFGGGRGTKHQHCLFVLNLQHFNTFGQNCARTIGGPGALVLLTTACQLSLCQYFLWPLFNWTGAQFVTKKILLKSTLYTISSGCIQFESVNVEADFEF